ncbi:MAG TPA: hypothetical protein VIJ51_14350 [Solirubrobacteraceae bacterium]
MSQPQRRIFIVVVLAFVTANWPPTAQAGTYVVRSCSAAPGSVDNAWVPFNVDPAELQTSTACGLPDVTGLSSATSGLAASDAPGSPTTVPGGESAGWRFTAPAGDAVSGIILDRDLFFTLAPGWLAEVVDATGTPLPGEACVFDFDQSGCEVQGTTSHAALDTTSLAIQVVCDPAPAAQTSCSGGQPEHRARVELNAATVTVTDNQPPTVTAATGALFSPSGYQHGVLTGTIAGSDDSGVSSVRVYVDGNPVAQSAFNCDYTYAQPCPATATSPTLSLDTTRLADGPHQVQAAVTDAAGNETRGPALPLLVANHPPGAPTAVGVANSPTGWINHAATITWKNPAQGAGLPLAAVGWVACRGVDSSIPASGCGSVHSQATPLTSLTEDPRTEPAFAGQVPGSYTVFVWLIDSSGDVNPASAGRASFGFDNTSPGPPSTLKATPSSTGRSFMIRATPGPHVAPISSVNWVACRTAGKCTAAKNVSGDAFGFDPATNPTFRSAPRGRYVVAAWLEDAAGNTSRSAARSTTLNYPHAGGSSGTPTARASPLLRLTAVKLVSRTLRVTGTASRALHGHVHVTERCLVGRVLHTIRRTATAAAGHFSTGLVQPRGGHAERLTVTFAGDKHLRAETVTRTFAHP